MSFINYGSHDQELIFYNITRFYIEIVEANIPFGQKVVRYW